MSVYSLVSAGSNARGQLASGSCEDSHLFAFCRFVGLPPGVLPGEGGKIIQVACGSNHTLILIEYPTTGNIENSSSVAQRELWGCGDGSKGQLGASSTTQDPSFSTSVFHKLDLDLHRLGDDLQNYTVRAVSASWETSYVVLSSLEQGKSDVLLSMGADDFGDLGIGGARARRGAMSVYTVRLEAAAGLSQDDKLRSTLSIQNIATGPHHVVVNLSVTEPGGSIRKVLVGWGASRHGQLGSHIDSATRKPVPFITLPRTISPHTIESPVSSSALGSHHSVFLHTSGRLSSLGSDRKDQLTGIDTLQGVTSADCTWNGTYAVVEEDGQWSVFSAGNHTKGQLGRPLDKEPSNPHSHSPLAVHFPFDCTTHRLVKIACGSEHVLCLFDRTGPESEARHPPEVWGWGWNEHGNLGLGHTQDQDLPVKIWPAPSDEEREAVDIWGGYGTSWILLRS